MGKSKEFDNILDECLERLLVKGESIEQCLASYPKQADELEPLLRTAQAAKQASAIQPSPEFRARARYQFRSALREAASKSRPLLSWLPRWATVVTVVLIFLLAGGGTVAAAGNSMPDEPLYQVKLATEQVRLKLTPSKLARAQLYARFTDKRVLEIARMAKKGKPEQVEKTSKRLDNYLTKIVSLAEAQRERDKAVRAPALAPSAEGSKRLPVRVDRRVKLRRAVARYAMTHPAALRAALKTAPESAKPALRRALAISIARYQRALKALD
jgi:hypothetical protein